MHFLPGEHIHEDYALINHLVSKCERWCRCLIFGLKENKKQAHYMTNTENTRHSAGLRCGMLELYLS